MRPGPSRHGFPREPDQTPYEFSQQVGTRVKSLAGDLRTLADLYYRAAYARGSLSLAGVAAASKFWEQLRPRRHRLVKSNALNVPADAHRRSVAGQLLAEDRDVLESHVAHVVLGVRALDLHQVLAGLALQTSRS